MDVREEILQAMAALEAQRTVLGSAAVDAALEGLQNRLTGLEHLAYPHARESKEPPWTSERKLVTILFCDIKGSTAMAEQLDPEEWADIMNRGFQYLISPVYRYEGMVARLMGDSILAFFGAPIAHENDPERAVLAGLDILEGIQEFRQEVKRVHGLDFNARVGINTGLVVVGTVGSDLRVEYTAMGDAVNLAARMEQTAQPGTVQISEQTHRLVEQLFECKPLGEIKVKGKRKPVHTYRVLSLKADVGPRRGLERQGLQSPLVGREIELASLSDSLDRLFEGQGGVVGIIGEAGIGKSRLISELRQGFPANRLYWLEGHTLSFGQAISYWPFQTILRSYAGISEDDSEGEAWRKVENKVHGLFGEATINILPYLASLLAIEVRGEYAKRVKYLEGEAMGKQIFLTSRRFFERLARAQPTVLVFEDLHWMDDSSTNLLEHLIPITEAVPLLIIGISRPEGDTPFKRLQRILETNHPTHYQEIRLLPLSNTDSKKLVNNLVEIDHLPVHVREMIVSKAEGNPFYIEEVIRTLIDHGVVTRDAATGRWQATARIGSIIIPDTIQGVIMARVDRLDEQVKQVLKIASVIGRSFLYRVLKGMSDAGQQLDDHLTELQETELIYENQLASDLEFIFKHAIVQEATYESILIQKRRELHLRVGQAIESIFADRLDEFYGLLAYHYAKAELWQKAQEYLLKAGDQAGRVAADMEALTHYRQAMEAYARAFGDQWDPVQRATLERKIGEAHLRRGENSRALEYFEQAITHLGHRIPMSRLQVRRAILAELIRQIGHRTLPIFSQKGAVDTINEGSEEAYRIFMVMSTVTVLANQERFLFEVLRSLNMAEENKNLFVTALGSTGIGMICDFLPAFLLARSYHRRASQIAEQLLEPYPLGMASIGLGLHHALQGNFPAAKEACERATHYFREAGNFRQWGLATETLGQILAFQDNFSQARSLAQELVQIGKESSDEGLECWGWVVLGMVERREGHIEEAILHLQKSIKLAERIPDYYSLYFASGELGQCTLRQGQTSEALAILERNRKAAAERRIRGNAITPVYHGLAEAYLQLAEQDNQSDRKAWMHKAKQACSSALKQAKAFRGGMPEAMRLQGRYKWLSGRPNNARKWWERSLAEAEKMGMGYEKEMTMLEMGQRSGN